MIDIKAEAKKCAAEFSENLVTKNYMETVIIALCRRYGNEKLEDAALKVAALAVSCETEKWFRITCVATIRASKEEEGLNG